MNTWTRRGLLLYSAPGIGDTAASAIAQAYVDIAGLETYANEFAMWGKAAAHSDDYGVTETHRSISMALSPALADAITAALAGTDGLWYLLDADTDELISTNDPARLDGDTVTHGLDWDSGIAVSVGEVLRYRGQFFEVVQGHTTQNDWTPTLALALFKPYLPPGEALTWRQPFGGHDAYPVGARVLFEGEVWVNTIPANVWQPGVTGWQRENEPEPTPDWKAGVTYKVGDVVSHQGGMYKCLQAHVSQQGWYPPVVPALWALV